MADASPGQSVGGITFKISVDLSAVDMKGLLDLNLRFNALEKAFEKLARNAEIVSYAFTELALINKTMRETIGKLTGAKNDLEKAQKKLIAASKTYQAALKQTADQTKESEAKTVSLTDKVSGLASAATTVASAFASLRLGEFIKEATLYAGRVENLGTILEQVGLNAGYTRGELGNFEESVKSLGITTEAARYSMTLMARNHLDLAKAAELARLAQDSAVIAGLNSSDSFEKIAISVQRLDTRMLRNQGILINLRNEYQRFALAAGRTETSLTAAERQQILLNAVLRAGVDVAGTYEAAMEDTYKQWTSLVRFTREALKEFGEEFQEIFAVAVQSITKLLQVFIAAPSQVKSFIAALSSFVVVAGSAAAAIAGITFALRGLAFAAASHPALLALAVTLGAIGSAATIISGQIGEMKREREAINALSGSEAARLVGLRNIVEELKVLHEQQSNSASARNEYLIGLDRAIRMTGEYEKDIRKLIDAEQQYQKVLEVSPTSPEQAQEQQMQKVREIEERLREARSESFRGSSGITGDIRDTGTAELEEELRIAVAIGEKIKEEWKFVIDAQKTRALETAIEAQDNVFQQSLRLQDNLQRARVKAAKDANVEIASSYTELRDAVEGTIVSEDDLRKHSELRRESERRRITESYTTEINNAKTEAEQIQKRAEMNVTLIKSEESIRQELETRLNTRKKLIESIDEMYRISMQQLKQEELSTKLLERRSDALGIGVAKELVDIEEDNIKILEQQRIALEELYSEKKKLSELTIQSGDAEKKRRQDLEVNEKAIQNNIRNTTVVLEDNLRKRRDYWRDAMKDRLEQMETLNEELAELEGKQTKMTVKEIQKRREERKKDMEDTAKFIRDQKIDIMEKEQPGREGITSEFDRYKEAISKAQTPQQLAELRKLFPKKLAGAYDERAENLRELEEKIADKQRKLQGELAEKQYRIFSAENPMRRMQLVNEYQQYVMEKQKELHGDYKEREKMRGQIADRGRFIGVARNSIEQEIRKREQELRDQQNLQKEEDRIMKEKIASKKAELFEAQEQLKVEQEKTREYEKQLAIAKMIRGERNLATAKTPEERQAAIETITSGQKALWDIKNRPLPKTAEDAERMYAPRATSASWWEGRRRGVGPPIPPPVAPRPLPAYEVSDMSGNVSVAGVEAAKGVGRMGSSAARGFNTAAKVIKKVNETAKTAAQEIEVTVVKLEDLDEETRQLKRSFRVTR